METTQPKLPRLAPALLICVLASLGRLRRAVDRLGRGS